LAQVFLYLLCNSPEPEISQRSKEDFQISSKTHSLIYIPDNLSSSSKGYSLREREQFQTHSFVKKESQLSISLSFTNYAFTENL